MSTARPVNYQFLLILTSMHLPYKRTTKSKVDKTTKRNQKIEQYRNSTSFYENRQSMQLVTTYNEA